MDTCTLKLTIIPVSPSEEANCRLNPVFSTTQKVSLINVLKMNKRTNVQRSQYCKEDGKNFQKYCCFEFVAGQKHFYCAHV